MASITLPYYLHMECKNYGELFRSDSVVVQFNAPIVMILGGNGLGKTTLLQSLVYCVAGGWDDQGLEPVSSRRWNHTYFHGRIPENALKQARVMVEFRLGDTMVHVERGFANSAISGCAVTSNGRTVTSKDTGECKELYQDTIRSKGGYRHFNDFRYVVQRLTYLAEDRRDITWDQVAQDRILMLVNNDLLDEERVRVRRNHLQEINSRKRHIRVEIGHVRDAIAEREPGSPKQSAVSEEVDSSETDVAALRQQLADAIAKRQELERTLSQLYSQQSELSGSIDELSALQRQYEANIIARSLDQDGVGADLALRTLLHFSICPACGRKSAELQEEARRRAREGACMICGNAEHYLGETDRYEEVESQLSEKLRAMHNVELRISDIQHELRNLESSESSLRARYDLLRIYEPTKLIKAIKGSTELSDVSIDEIYKRLRDLEDAHQEAALQEQRLASELNKEYERYLEEASARLDTLVHLFEEQASQYLGSQATLEREDRTNNKKLRLSLLVPSFDGVRRTTPKHCSEAQRFFLDIAMRMAVLQLIQELSGNPNSFICETPESSLDYSYLNNVASMFCSFAALDHSVISTTNLQREGLAQYLQECANDRNLRTSFFDMLRIGRLSDVQTDAIDRLNEIRDEIVGTPE